MVMGTLQLLAHHFFIDFLSRFLYAGVRRPKMGGKQAHGDHKAGKTADERNLLYPFHQAGSVVSWVVPPHF